MTHVASAILIIGQRVADDWPLIIEDHHCSGHSITLKPGEITLYEAAILQYQRPLPLRRGQSF